MATFQLQMPTTAAASAFEAVLATGNVEAIAAVWQALKATAPAPVAEPVAEPAAAPVAESVAKPKSKASAIDKKAKKAKKDPNAPKRAMTAYQAYFAVEMRKLRDEAAKNGHRATTKEENDALMRTCGSSWKALSATKKNKWANTAVLRNQHEGRTRPAKAEDASSSASASEDDGNESE